ncbi:MAG: hypothetical protein WA874_13240 [Chryseosolibacter sp.]
MKHPILFVRKMIAMVIIVVISVSVHAQNYNGLRNQAPDQDKIKGAIVRSDFENPATIIK